MTDGQGNNMSPQDWGGGGHKYLKSTYQKAREVFTKYNVYSKGNYSSFNTPEYSIMIYNTYFYFKVMDTICR